MRQKGRHRRHRHDVDHSPASGAPTVYESSPRQEEASSAAMTQAEEQAVWRILSTGHTALNAIRLGEHAMHTTSHHIARSPYYDQYACRAGCSWCCYIPVAVTPPEALVMAQYLRKRMSAEELCAVRERLAEQAERIAHLSSAAHAEARMPCALLREGQCMVYEARPIRCRRWNSVDSAACEVGFHDAHAAVVPIDAYGFAAGGSIQAGLHAGARQVGLDGTWYELHSVVWRALEVADAADHWVRGAAVFGDCTPIERRGSVDSPESL